MTISYTLHTLDCPSAVEQNAPVVDPDDYPGARKHRCVYYTNPLPVEVRVTSTEDVIPPASAAKRGKP